MCYCVFSFEKNSWIQKKWLALPNACFCEMLGVHGKESNFVKKKSSSKIFDFREYTH